MSMPAIGSVWKERDRRFERYIKVIEIVQARWVRIRTCEADGSEPERTRRTLADMDAFGKRYKLVEDSPTERDRT